MKVCRTKIALHKIPQIGNTADPKGSSTGYRQHLSQTSLTTTQATVLFASLNFSPGTFPALTPPNG